MREEVERDRVAGRNGLGLEQRAAPWTDELADVLQRGIARLRTWVQLLKRRLGIPHVHERVQLPVAGVLPELVPAVAFDDSFGSLLDDREVLADRKQNRFRPFHALLHHLDVAV